MNILMFYFKSTIDGINIGKKKRSFKYSQQSIKKDYTIKTYINETAIYTNKSDNTNDHLMELFTESMNGIMGIENIFEESNPKEDEISDFTVSKNIIIFLKEFNLNKKEIKALSHISQLVEKN